MEYVALAAAIVAFTLSLHVFRVVGLARRILTASSSAVTTMGRAALSDDEKEAAVQRAAIEVLRAFVALVAGVGVSVLLSLAVIYVGTAVDAYTLDELTAAAGNWYFIAGSSLFVIAAMFRLR